MLKIPNLFNKKKVIKPNLIKPDLHTHRKSPLDPLRAKSLAQEAIEETDNLINEFGPRLSGTTACKDCANKINERLNEYCDFTAKQEFMHKGKSHDLWLSFIPYIYLSSILLLLFGFPILSLLFNLSFLFYVYRNFIIYNPILESKVENTEGINVHGVIEPKNEVKKTIVFSSHHDSAKLLNTNKGEKGYFLKVEIPLLLYFLSLFINIIELIVELITGRFFKIGFPPLTSIIILIVLLLCFPIILKIKNYFSDKGSYGAGDNLISSSVLIQLSRYFNWKKIRNEGLENTRLVFVSFDAEEVGLRGSKIWFDKHSALLENAIQLNFDCIYNSDELVFIDSDINGFVSLSKDLATKCVKLANSMGYEAKNYQLPFLSGATDAASGYRANIDSCSMMAVDFEKGIKDTYFHTINDTVDKIELKAVEKAIAIAIKLCNTIDNNSFNEEELIMEENQKDLDIKDLLKFNKISRR